MIDAAALQIVLTTLTGWLDRRERQAIAYLIEENRLMRRLWRTTSRTHLSLEKDSPAPRPVAPPKQDRVITIPQVGGLHLRYDRRAA